MADLGMDLDHERVERGRDFTPIPAGTYLAQIKASEVVNTKNGGGKMLKLQFEILEGPHERRVVFDQINYVNVNPTAQLIGQQRVKAICEAVGHVGVLRDTEVLEFKPVLIRVVIKKDDTYGDKNEIKDVKPANSGQPPSGRTPGSTAPAAAASPQPGPQGAPSAAARTTASGGGAAWRRP